MHVIRDRRHAATAATATALTITSTIIKISMAFFQKCNPPIAIQRLLFRIFRPIRFRRRRFHHLLILILLLLSLLLPAS